MSTPKLNVRNGSFTFKRDLSVQRIASRERIKDTDEVYMKKRFRIQPYSSFEDKFIEQDKINQYIFEQLTKIDAKIGGFGRIGSEYSDLFNGIQLLKDRIQDFFVDLEQIRGTSKDFFEFKEAILKKIGNDEDFKGKSSEKDKILFEEVVRLGQVLENCEKNMEDLKKKSVNSGKVQVLSENFENLDEKIKSFESIYENLKALIDKDSSSIVKLSQSNSVLKSELESYMQQVSQIVTQSLTTMSDAMLKRILDEQESRQKNTIDLKYLLEKNVSGFNERFFSELLPIKSFLQSLDSQVFQQQSFMESVKTEFFASLQSEKSEILSLISNLEKNFSEHNKELTETFKSLKTNQESVFTNFSTTIFAEIQTRVQAEHELQNMIKITSKSIFQEIHDLRAELIDLKDHLSATETEIRNSVIEKCDLLSRYTETELKKVKSVISNNVKKYQSTIPREIDTKIDLARADFIKALKETRDDLSISLKQIQDRFTKDSSNLREECSANIKLTQDHFSKSSSDLHTFLTKSLTKINENFENTSENFQYNLETLDKKITEIDEHSYKDLTEIAEYLNQIEEVLEDLQSEKSQYQEIIAKLETQIEVKLINEKVSREHSISFFTESLSERISALKKKTKTIPVIFSKLTTLDEHYIEVSKSFELFRANIQSELSDFFQEAERVKEKIEINEVIVDEIKEKMNEVHDKYLSFGVILRSSLAGYDQERRISESRNVVNDLTNRVETMGILGKLDNILVEMDANERETQAMLMLYKKELQFVQEKQKKGLEDAQNAVKGIFDAKIAGLQSMVSEEMEKILGYIEENKVLAPNLSSLQQYASKVKIVPKQIPDTY